MAEKILMGKDFLLFAERDNKLVPVCCSRDLTVSTNADTIEATKAPQSIWKSFIYGDLGYSISTSGLISISEGFGIEDIQDAQFNRLPLKFMAREGLGNDILLSGTVLVASIEMTGAYKDAMIMSFSGLGDGPLSRTKVLQTFPLVDGEGNTIVDGEGNIVVVAPDQYGTDIPIDISIDC